MWTTERDTTNAFQEKVSESVSPFKWFIVRHLQHDGQAFDPAVQRLLLVCLKHTEPFKYVFFFKKLCTVSANTCENLRLSVICWQNILLINDPFQVCYCHALFQLLQWNINSCHLVPFNKFDKLLLITYNICNKSPIKRHTVQPAASKALCTGVGRLAKQIFIYIFFLIESSWNSEFSFLGVSQDDVGCDKHEAEDGPQNNKPHPEGVTERRPVLVDGIPAHHGLQMASTVIHK